MNFYNSFHKKTSIQYKVILDNNFTYYYVINFYKKIFNKNQKKLKILDYGSGSGSLSLYFANKGYKVLGVDISTDAIKKAINSAKANSLEKNADFYTVNKFNKNIKRYKNKFDLILCIEVLEHIKNDNILFSNLIEQLKKGGYLFLSTPSEAAPLYKMGLLSNFDKKVGHLRRYSKQDIEKLVENNNQNEYKIIPIEGILRNLLYTNDDFGIFIKFIRGPIVPVINFVDNILIKLFGNSNYFLIVKKR